MPEPGLLKSEETEEEGVSRPEDSLRLLVDAVRDYAIFMLDPAGYVRSWNPGAQRLKGYNADEIIGQHFSVFYPEESKEIAKSALELALRDGRFENEGWRIRKDGTRFWAEVVITPVYDHLHRLIGFGKVTRDLTTRRAVEESLRMSEMKFRLLVESVSDYAIFMIDPAGYITSWNTGAQRIKGYNADEIIGQHFSVFYPEEDMYKSQVELRGALRDGRYEDEGWRLRKDGTRFWANVIITPVFDDQDRLLGYSKVTRDLTERRAAEDEIRILNADLERRVKDRTAELHAIIGELQSFSYTVAHDLRAPVRAIDAFTHMMLESSGASDPEIRRFGEKIKTNAVLMGRLIDGLLHFAGLGRAPMEMTLVDMKDLARNVIASLGSEVIERQIEWRLGELPRAHGDAALLRQVFANLIENALKFTRAREVSQIEIGYSKETSPESFYVRDNGVGFKMKYAPKLFGVFQRLHTQEEFEGTGIGLATVDRIIRRHGGKVWARGEPNQGATFYFHLPKSVDYPRIAEQSTPVPEIGA